MSVITTNRATERLTRKLKRAGINQWVAKTSGDAFGKYLRFVVGGKCVGGCGWTLSEAEEIVDKLIALEKRPYICPDCGKDLNGCLCPYPGLA